MQICNRITDVDVNDTQFTVTCHISLRAAWNRHTRIQLKLRNVIHTISPQPAGWNRDAENWIQSVLYFVTHAKLHNQICTILNKHSKTVQLASHFFQQACNKQSTENPPPCNSSSCSSGCPSCSFPLTLWLWPLEARWDVIRLPYFQSCSSAPDVNSRWK